jgi:hypothetical protein
VIIFGSIRFLSKKKKVTKQKKTETKPKPVQTDRFRFGSFFLDKNRFKLVWLGFFGLARFFLVWLGFFRFGFDSVRFFQFQTYKTETEAIGFFKNLIGFFSQFGFFCYFFTGFLGLISFSVFFAHP